MQGGWHARACQAALAAFLTNPENCDLTDQQLATLSCAAETLLEQAGVCQRAGRGDRRSPGEHVVRPVATLDRR